MKLPYIIVDREQANVIRNARGTVDVRGPDGTIVGYISPPPSEEELSLAKKRLSEGPNEPCYTTEEVLEHLQSLDQRNNEQGPGQR